MSKGYHASNERKRKPDYDKGFNDDRTVADAGERILEMTEKTRRSMEESMAKTAKKIKEAKKQEETSEVRKTKQKMQNAWRKAKERTQKIKQSIVGKWDNIADHKKSIEDYIEDHTGKKDRKKKIVSTCVVFQNVSYCIISACGAVWGVVLNVTFGIG
ncbi:hypothetical protein HAX54_029391 [Datura stramonium]|uniref:Uncharacterized protein n=1 Tax=Datura stramonium TaxID=4076 RepID=A0ABS8V5U8_DATST|nr:hypothetical protein [Datura stramonium]